MRTAIRRRTGAAVLAFAMVTALLAASPIGSASAASCALTPRLRDVTVVQGVGSYSPLVRGKEALVRAYLSLPACAVQGSSIAVTDASLVVTTPDGATSVDPDNLVTDPAPTLAPFANAPAVDSPADTRFVIPGSALAPAATTDKFTATMALSISYSARTSKTEPPVTGTVQFTTKPGTRGPISATVEKRTNALRVLVVPMGDPTLPYAQQFNANAQSTTSGAMRALARVLPVPDDTGDLTETNTSAGIRYAVSPTIADIRAFQQTIGDASKFCGTAANFDRVAANLSTFLQSWNTNNPTFPADRVVGVVQGSLSFGGDAGCAEGMSKVGQPITWTRLVAGGTSPSQTGSTMAMEIAHTFGDVPLTALNADPFSRYHSKNIQSDDTAPNRAYNVPTRQFLATDRTVMAVRDTWNDQTTLLEPSDWSFILCALTPDPLPSTCSPSTVTIGTAQNVGNEPTFVISGVITEGTPPTADVTESYFKNGVARFNVNNSSDIRLVQEDANGDVVSDVGLAIDFETSDHHDDGDPVTTEPTASFTAAVPFDTAADRIKLMHDTDVLYSRSRIPQPEVADVSQITGPGSTERVSSWTGPAGDSDNQSYDTTYSSDISGDGKFVVFSSQGQLNSNDTNEYADVYLRDVANQTTTLISEDPFVEGGGPSDGPSGDPVISADGSTVAFVSSAHNLVSPSPPDEYSHVYVYDVATGSMQLADVSSGGDVANLSALNRPALSANGQYVAFTSQADNLALLTAPDTGYASRVYLRSLTGGWTELVSLRSEGCGSLGATCVDHGELPGSITDDGRFISFVSDTPLTSGDDGSGAPSPGTLGAYVRDRQLQTTRLATKGNVYSDPCDTDGCSVIDGPVNGNVIDPPLLSPLNGPDEAKYMVFDSDASNLVPNDNNAATDVFVSTIGLGVTTRISQVPGTTPIDGTGDLDADSYLLDVTPDLGCASENPSCANDILLSTNADNFRIYDFNGIQDIYSYDFATSPDLGPTLVDVDNDGLDAVADLDTSDPTLVNAPLPGGISDNGKSASFVSTAANLDVGDTNNRADAFVRHIVGHAGSGSGEPYTVIATSTKPQDLRIDLMFRCGSVNYPVAVALEPDAVRETSSSWNVNVDAGLIGSCPPGSGLVAVANDGFTTSQPVDAIDQPSLNAQPPAPSIYGPAAGSAYSTYLQYSTVTLDGTARDAEDGVLDGSHLAWFVTAPGGSEQSVGAGTSLPLTTPAGGYAPGVYDVRLRATDSDGQFADAFSTFTILADEDNDGVPAQSDQLGDIGTGCSGAGSGDQDPSNAYADPDGDGVSSIDEVALGEQPCVAASGGTAGLAKLKLKPNPLPLRTTQRGASSFVTGRLTVANAAETQVLSSSVHLTLTANIRYNSEVTLDVALLRSRATSRVFIAKFDRQSIVDFAKKYCLKHRPITAVLTGFVSGSGPITATTKLYVKK